MLDLLENMIKLEQIDALKKMMNITDLGDMLAEMGDICQMNAKVSKIIQVIYSMHSDKKRIEEVVMTKDLKTVTLA